MKGSKKMIKPIEYLRTAYRAARPSRKIMQQGYTKGYFMETSPLSKSFQQPSKMTRICQNIKKYITKLLEC